MGVVCKVVVWIALAQGEVHRLSCTDLVNVLGPLKGREVCEFPSDFAVSLEAVWCAGLVSSELTQLYEMHFADERSCVSATQHRRG
jgi:hypothetical protein